MLVASVAVALTRTARGAEPMRRWEDVSATTVFLDGVAEVLGHDPAQNLFVSAQHQELAARYNGGPCWEGGRAQECGRDFEAHREEAAGWLR